MDDTTFDSPPTELVQFVESVAKGSAEHRIEQRQFPRYKLTCEVWVQPVNNRFEPLGDAFVAVSRDISAAGIGFVHSKAIRDKYLWLRLVAPGGKRMNVIVEVVRCRPLGVFYEVGSKFVAKLDEAKGFELPSDVTK